MRTAKDFTIKTLGECRFESPLPRGKRIFVSRLHENGGEGDQYEFDGAGGLTRAKLGVPAIDIEDPLSTTQASDVLVQYDPAGNRLGLTVSGVTTTFQPAADDNSYSSVGGAAYTYDAKGSLRGDGAHVFVYDFAEQVTVFDPEASSYEFMLQPEGTVGDEGTFWLGTDDFGRDLLTRIIAAERSPSTTLVSAIMSSPIMTCRSGTKLDELRQVMREERIRHVPVVENHAIVGMVSIGDLNIADVKVMTETISYLEQYMYSA